MRNGDVVTISATTPPMTDFFKQSEQEDDSSQNMLVSLLCFRLIEFSAEQLMFIGPDVNSEALIMRFGTVFQ